MAKYSAQQNRSKLNFDIVRNVGFLNIFVSQNYLIRIKGQSEHSGLCPDIRATMLSLMSK